MKPDAIKRLFPNASASVLAANAQGAGETAKPQYAVSNDTLEASQAESGDRGRFLVVIVSIRKRLLDEDNLVAKYHTDLLRYAGVIPEDNPLETEIRVTQRKAQKGETEFTQITVYGPPC